MRVAMTILVLYLLLNVLVLAFFLDKILEKAVPGQDVLYTFSGFVLYYFLLDLIMRFQFQELPTLSIKPYLHLPVRRNQIINYLSFISLGTAFNLIPFLLTGPFLFMVIGERNGASAFWAYLISIAGLTFFNHFFSLWLKRKVNLNVSWMLSFFLVLLLLISFDLYLGLFSISGLSSGIFAIIAARPLSSSIFILLALGMYLINHRYLKNNLYLDEIQSPDATRKSGTDIPFLDRFGIAGDLAANEIKLILRNKRPRSTIMMCLFFMLYGLIFYTKEGFSGYTAIVFCGMFMTGIFIIHYGQFMFSWQSAHFDGLLAGNISARDFFRAKFLLFTLFSSICFILTVPYVYFGWKVLITHFIMYIWNLGVNTLLVLYFANRNYKRIDLSSGSAFNWEGVGSSQWILSIPLLLAPFLIYLPFNYYNYPEAGLGLIAITGLGFIITREFWLNKLVTSFKTKRYIIAEGFRNR